MAIVIVNENSKTGKKLMDIIHSCKENDDNAVQLCNDAELEEFLLNRSIVQEQAVGYNTIQTEDDDDDEDDIPFERIPGLLYTQEERVAAVREAITEIHAGASGVDSEEVYKRIQERFNGNIE